MTDNNLNGNTVSDLHRERLDAYRAWMNALNNDLGFEKARELRFRYETLADEQLRRLK